MKTIHEILSAVSNILSSLIRNIASKAGIFIKCLNTSSGSPFNDLCGKTVGLGSVVDGFVTNGVNSAEKNSVFELITNKTNDIKDTNNLVHSKTNKEISSSTNLLNSFCNKAVNSLLNPSSKSSPLNLSSLTNTTNFGF